MGSVLGRFWNLMVELFENFWNVLRHGDFYPAFPVVLIDI